MLLRATYGTLSTVGVGEPLVGRLLLYDARDTRFEIIEYRWNPANPLNGSAALPATAGAD